MWDGTGAKGNAAEGRVMLADLALEEGHTAEAESGLRKAIEVLSAEGNSEGEAFARSILAEALINTGDRSEAEKQISQAQTLAPKVKDLMKGLDIELSVAQAEAALGKTAVAKKLLESGLAEATKYGLVPHRLEAQLELYKIEMKFGNTTSGRAHLTALEKDATAKGFLLIARKAHAAQQ
jgi:hypothetical protein